LFKEVTEEKMNSCPMQGSAISHTVTAVEVVFDELLIDHVSWFSVTPYFKNYNCNMVDTTENN
jgi:hypothetical protein